MKVFIPEVSAKHGFSLPVVSSYVKHSPTRSCYGSGQSTRHDENRRRTAATIVERSPNTLQ